MIHRVKTKALANESFKNEREAYLIIKESAGFNQNNLILELLNAFAKEGIVTAQYTPCPTENKHKKTIK